MKTRREGERGTLLVRLSFFSFPPLDFPITAEVRRFVIFVLFPAWPCCRGLTADVLWVQGKGKRVKRVLFCFEGTKQASVA